MAGVVVQWNMLWLYLGFVCLVLVLLALDLGVFHRTAHVVSVREALGWSAFWIALGLAFVVFIYLGYEGHWLGLGLTPDRMAAAEEIPGVGTVYNDGSSAAVKYLTGYVVEKSLAVDNIFVIAVVFGFFSVPRLYQHRVLFWGIAGALLMRGAMIALGAALLSRFGWIVYVFGGVLILTGARMLLADDTPVDPGRNPLVRLTRRLLPVSERFHGEHFFVRAGSAASREAEQPGMPAAQDAVVNRVRPGRLLATPLLLALVMVEFTDVVFAVDSIPAIFAITADPFLVFTSNVFAILGLRSLYFALAGLMGAFRYLKVSLAAVLVVVGGKMLAHQPLRELLGEAYNLYTLGLVLAILTAGVAASALANRRDGGKGAVAPAR